MQPLGFKVDSQGDYTYNGVKIHIKGDVEDNTFYFFFQSGKGGSIDFSEMSVIEFLLTLKIKGVPPKLNYAKLIKSGVIAPKKESSVPLREKPSQPQSQSITEGQRTSSGGDLL